MNSENEVVTDTTRTEHGWLCVEIVTGLACLSHAIGHSATRALGATSGWLSAGALALFGLAIVLTVGAILVSAVLGLIDSRYRPGGFQTLSLENAARFRSTHDTARCPICGDHYTDPDREILICRSCRVPHHGDCVAWSRSCGIFGCTEGG